MIVITVLEQEHGTELDLVPTHHLLAMERKGIMSQFLTMKSTKNRLLHQFLSPKNQFLLPNLILIVNHYIRDCAGELLNNGTCDDQCCKFQHSTLV